MGRKDKAKSKRDKKKSKLKEPTQYDVVIQRLAFDGPVKDFICKMKSEEELDEINFPNVKIRQPSLENLRNFRAKEGSLDPDLFGLLNNRASKSNIKFENLSEEELKEQRNQVMEELRIERRQFKWKKYQYAIHIGLDEDWYDKSWKFSEEGVEDSGREEEEEEGVEAGDGDEEEGVEAGDGDEEEGVEAGDGDEEEAVIDVVEERSEEGNGEEGGETIVAKVSRSEVEASGSGSGLISEQETVIKVEREGDIGGIPYRQIAANPFMSSFPQFEDGDIVSQYTAPFSLLEWLNSHRGENMRYLPHVANDLGFGIDVESWSGDRLKRESLGILSSVLSAVMDYHKWYGPHGNIADYANIMLRQYVLTFGGSEKIAYDIKLPSPGIRSEETSELQGLSEDMGQVKLIFEKVLEGRNLNSEMEFLLTTLMGTYPYGDKAAWKYKLLRNCPVLWDGKGRAKFIIDFYYHLISDSHKSYDLNRALHSIDKLIVPTHFTHLDWIEKIPNSSIYYDILTFSPANAPANANAPAPANANAPAPANANAPAPVNAPANPPKPQYNDAGIPKEVLRYVRATLHHHRQTQGVGLKEINNIELCLSNLFDCFTIGLYMGMCRYNVFFN